MVMKEKDKGSMGSLSFLHKLNFHNKHSPTIPTNGSNLNLDEEKGLPPLSASLEQLSPCEELKTIILDETAEEPSTSSFPKSQNAANNSYEDVWFESTQAPIKNNLLENDIRLDSLSGIDKRRSILDRQIQERESVQTSLETHLENFRQGRMRSLTDVQVEKMRSMHQGQLKLTALYQKFTGMDDPLNDLDTDEKFGEISKCLDELHYQIDNFSETNEEKD